MEKFLEGMLIFIFFVVWDGDSDMLLRFPRKR